MVRSTFKNLKKLLKTSLLIIVFTACQEQEKKDGHEGLFTEVSSDRSQLSFINQIHESDTLNYLNFPYIYMGGGVAVGDFNQDGLSDIYLTGDMTPNKLYLNQGNLVFKDISEMAGVSGDERWYTGVTLVDINNDGYLDIYLSVSGLSVSGKNTNTRNQLFVNNGDLTFTEKAADYKIDDPSNSIQSTFLDYDRDGDLDLFVANYPPVPLTRGNLFYKALMEKNDLKFSGHLYQNKGDHFEEVTAQAGVQNFGLTLGLCSSDLNHDGWPDLYLSNDFNVPDYLYLNQKDGTFKEVIQAATGHTSMFGMGIDIADLNNDGWPDMTQADMTPEDYTRATVNMAGMNPESFWQGVELGFHYQYMQNSMQINNGTDDQGIPVFSEISRLAGVATTDWSWSTLLFDMDNDGWKDLYITNGMKRDVNDNDLNDRSSATTFRAAFKQRSIEEYPSEPLSNYAFKNRGDFTFEKMTERWGLARKSFSNGVAYGDLDQDGDLDMVVNNLDQEVSLFENHAKNHFLRVKLSGPEKNLFGIGTKVSLKNLKTGLMQYQEMTLTRGFQSSVEPVIHFGLGSETQNMTLEVTWPDGKRELLFIDSQDATIEVSYSNAAHPATEKKAAETYPRFKKLTNVDINYRHKEDDYDDYSFEPLLPYKYSTLGPGMAVGDVNNDGLEDIYLGNARNAQGKLFVQGNHAPFRELKAATREKDKMYEDTGALFFDADGDDDQDLYVASGGYDKNLTGQTYQDRLYLNQRGAFVQSDALPKMPVSGAVVAAADYDKDGDLDIFTGGRVVPGSYPSPPQSYLLENNGSKGQNLKFIDITDEVKGLSAVGMVTDAIWMDFDQNGWEDLLISGEWMPLTLFMNYEGSLINETEKWNLSEKTGWWYALESFDIDQDGDMDLVAGNLGLNYKYKASPDKPFEVFLNDFDQNGKQDIVLGVHKEGRLLPLRGRACSSEQIPAIKAKYATYREFASADLPDIYGKNMLENAIHYQATSFAHYWLENTGEGAFEWHALPPRSQFSPINDLVSFDYDRDGFQDLLVVGSMYDAEVETPRADAGIGLVLRNKKGAGFEAIPAQASGLCVRGNVKKVKQITLQGNPVFLFAKNNAPPEFWKLEIGN